MIERLAGLAWYPCRCGDCGHRFLISRWVENETRSPEHASTEREIRITRGAYRRRQQLRLAVIYGMALAVFLVFLYLITRETGASASEASALPLRWNCRG